MSTIRARWTAYAALAPLFAFVVVYQLRISIETVRLERTLDYFVPFLLEPFTNRIDERGHVLSSEEGDELPFTSHSALRWQDELLSVNGRIFTGMTVYLQELWKDQHQRWRPPLQWHPFTITVRSGGSRVHRIVIGFPHCTCGVPGLLQATATWLFPPMFCVLCGFAAVGLRPRAILSWAFLAIMLSLSQLQLSPEWYTGFQLTVSPMRWTDCLRIPAVGYRSFVQNAWPAALVVFGTYFVRPRQSARRAALALAAVFLTLAALQAALQVAWSEDFRNFTVLFRLLERFRTEQMVVAIAGVTGLAWLLNRGYGLAAMTMASVAAVALYRGPSPITHGNWYTYSDNSFRFVAVIPEFHHTPELIALVFASACIVTRLALFRRDLRLSEIVGFGLLIPLAVDIGGCLGGFWYPLGWRVFEYWPWLVLSCAGIGLSILTGSVVKRAGPSA